MADQTKKDENSKAIDLLLADLKHIGEFLWRNEAIGETRLKFFITFVAAVITALVSLLTSRNFNIGTADQESKIILSIIIYALSFLFVVGVITLFRVITRNNTTDGLKMDLDDIRQRIKDYYDEENILAGYYPFRLNPTQKYEKEKEEDSESITSGKPKGKGIRKFGGIAHMIVGINSLILTGMLGVLLFSYSASFIIIWVLAVFIGSFALQLYYVGYREKHNRKKLNESNYTHAGGIVVRYIEGKENTILLVTAKENINQWVFPKGHIEKGEGHGETAVREVFEESGIISHIEKPIGSFSFLKDTNGSVEKVYCKIYLMKYIGEGSQNREKRKIKWYTLDEALNLVTFEDSKNLLKRVNFLIKKFKIKSKTTSSHVEKKSNKKRRKY